MDKKDQSDDKKIVIRFFTGSGRAGEKGQTLELSSIDQNDLEKIKTFVENCLLSIDPEKDLLVDLN